MTEAVDIEREFVCDALPVDLIGMNGRLMAQVRRVGCGCAPAVLHGVPALSLIVFMTKPHRKER